MQHFVWNYEWEGLQSIVNEISLNGIRSHLILPLSGGAKSKYWTLWYPGIWLNIDIFCIIVVKFCIKIYSKLIFEF